MVIDSHVHLYPPEVAADPQAWAAARGESHWATMCTRRRSAGRPVQTFPDLDRLLRDMDAAGIDRAVLLGWYWEHHSTCVEQNRFLGTCVRAHPDRLAGFATFHPAAGSEAVRQELGRCIEEGLCGIGELSPHSQHFPVDDPAFAEVLGLAATWRLPVNIHVTEPVGGAYAGRVRTPLEDFQRLACDHPDVTFILAHWGGLLPLHTLNRVAQRAFERTWFDTAASPLLYDRRVFRAVCDAVGPQRLLFGSDYPLVLYPDHSREPGWTHYLEDIAEAGLSQEERTALMGGNAQRLFGWS